MPRLLVIEDESRILRSLVKELQAAGFEVEAAATSDEGTQLAISQSFDCIVLDWMLPGRDELQVLSDFRKSRQKAPVLLLTARDAIEDRVIGLDSGAEDYLVKPWMPRHDSTTSKQVASSSSVRASSPRVQGFVPVPAFRKFRERRPS